MKNILSIIAILLFVVFTEQSCKGGCEPRFNLGVDIYVKDTLGNNLLDKATPKAYNKDSIKLYCLYPDGSKKEIPKREYTINDYLGVNLSQPTEIEWKYGWLDNSTIYIRWTQDDTDTIYSTLVYSRKCSNKYYSFKEVYYNGKLILVGFKDGYVLWKVDHSFTVVK